MSDKGHSMTSREVRPYADRKFYKRFRTSSKGPYICNMDFLTNHMVNVKMFPYLMRVAQRPL